MKKEVMIDVLKRMKADDIVVLKIAELTSIADYFIICTADNSTLSNMIIDSVQREMKNQHYPLLFPPSEYKSNWMILDYGDVVLHVFMEQERQKYDLESFWEKAPKTYITS